MAAHRRRVESERYDFQGGGITTLVWITIHADPSATDDLSDSSFRFSPSPKRLLTVRVFLASYFESEKSHRRTSASSKVLTRLKCDIYCYL